MKIKHLLIPAAALFVGLVVGTVWSIVADYMDPDGEYAAALRRAEHERALQAAARGRMQDSPTQDRW